jgi:glucose-1-phosphate adenylyltransferase
MVIERGDVYAYAFGGYWQDVGTLQSYWETNLALLDDLPQLNLYDPDWVIHTRSEERPPAKIMEGSYVRGHSSRTGASSFVAVSNTPCCRRA